MSIVYSDTGVSFSDTGLLDTGLFAGESQTWGWPELIVIGFAIWVIDILVQQGKRDIKHISHVRRKIGDKIGGRKK